MSSPHPDALAWVESPLQLLSAAEWAASEMREHGRVTSVAYRISDPQVVATAEALHRLGAPFARYEPFLGIPWSRLAGAAHWVVGDPLSGQFRAASSILPPPRGITVLDDGAMVVHVMRALAGQVSYARPGQQESAAKSVLGERSASRLRRLARDGHAELFTVFPEAGEIAQLLGFAVTAHRFPWVRAARRAGAPLGVRLPSSHLVLGSASVVDGALAPDRYLAWVARAAADAPIAYLPHRREDERMLASLAEIPGVDVVRTGLPIELVLAGASAAFHVRSLPSSAVTTLAAVLAGTGSSIRVDDPDGARRETVEVLR